MNRGLTGTVVSILLSLPAHADGWMTEEQIRQVVRITDAAAIDRNAAAIGLYLGDSFEKVIEFIYKDKWLAKVRVKKDEYLKVIDDGWADIEKYDYQRDDTVIHIMPDGLSGESLSTITETFVQDGEEKTSKFRETATYTMENGRPVITQISGHTLVGDTTW